MIPKKLKRIGIMLVAATGIAACTNDELQEINTGEDISFTTRVSRANTVTTGNLNGFYVYADADTYTSMFIDGVKAERKTGSNIFELAEKKTWPVDVNSVRFWAVGPLEAKENNWFSELSITASSQSANGFNVPTSVEVGGKDHRDLVLAYTEVERMPGNQISLDFYHALSQIEINAKLGDGREEGRRVYVKGAWLVNPKSKADIQFSESVGEEYHNMHWHGWSVPASYGCKLDPVSLTPGDGAPLVGDRIAHSSLLLIPQVLSAYQFPAANSTEDASLYAGAEPVAEAGGDGAYILFLCRVETVHETEAVDPSAEGAVGPYTDQDGNVKGHIHQLFPVTAGSDGKPVFKAEAYGYSCVPVAIDWKPGKKYVYTLEFCGKSSGAGVYPPADLPDVFTVDDLNTNTPEVGKKPGDPVLDSPITFEVEVKDWTEEDVQQPMN